MTKKISANEDSYPANEAIVNPDGTFRQMTEEEKVTRAKAEDFKNTQKQILQNLAARQRDIATEDIVMFIMRHEYIHTIRSDEKVEMFIYKNGVRLPKAKSYIQEYVREFLEDAYTTQLYNLVLSKIVADTFVEFEDFFIQEDRNLIPLKNCIYDLKTDVILEYTPRYYFFNKLPVKYDPKAECPNIKQHLGTVLQSQADIDVLQECFGWCLYRDYMPEKAFMFTGSGRNGKGKTIELLKQFLGIENCASINLKRLEGDTGQNFSISELFNKLANLGADISATKLEETNTFKSLTGHDMLNAPRKFLPDIKFTNYAKMIFSANELPKTADTTIAFFNRWILVDFPFTFYTEQEFEQLTDKTNTKIRDPEIINKLTTESEISGLFNWAVQGLKRLIQKKEFSVSSTTQQVKTSWIRKSDPLKAFIMDRIADDYDSEIDKRHFKAELIAYCQIHNERPPSDKEIKESLTSEHAVTIKRHRTESEDYFVWQGIKFKGSNEVNPDDNQRTL